MDGAAKQPHKLWTLFHALEEREREHFYRWLEAELSGKARYIRALGKLMLEAGGNQPSKEELWRKLYPDKSFEDGRMRKLMRDLTAYLEEFLAIQAFREDESAKDLYLLKALRSRHLRDVYLKFYRKIKRAHKEAPFRDSGHYRMAYELAYELGVFQLRYEHGIRQLPVEQLTQAFDAWWIHKKLEIACTNVSASAIMGTPPGQIPLLNQAVEALQDHPEYEQMDLFHLLWSLYRLIQGDPGVHAEEIQDQLLHSSAHVPVQHKREFFALLSNHYIRKLNEAGSGELAHTIFSLYKWAVNEGILLQDNRLHWQQFKNVIAIGLRTRNFETVEKWLESLPDHIESAERRDAYIFNKSQYHLEKGDFQEVLKLLRATRFKKVVYEIPARAALLQAIYELHGPYEDGLLAQLDNLIRYVNAQKLTESYKRSYLNRFRLFRKMLNAHSAEELKLLQQEVNTTRPVSRPEWLIRKIEESLEKLSV